MPYPLGFVPNVARPIFDEVEVEAMQSFLRTLDERVAHFNLVSLPPRVAATSAAYAG
jgi:hypothetical protein